MATFNGIVSCALTILIHVTYVISVDINVRGPQGDIFTGDYEKFTCDMEGHEVGPNFGYEWRFKLKTGDLVSMNESDALTALETKKYSEENYKLEVTSFLRVPSADVAGVMCYHSPKIVHGLDIQVKDLTAITADSDPCGKASMTDKPVISIFMPSVDIMTPSYRRSHYIDDQYTVLTYGVDATQFKLMCYSPSHTESPVWSMKKETGDKMKFASWTDDSKSCKQQVLHIYQVAGGPGELTNLKFTCSSGGTSSKVNLGFMFSPFRQVSDFNSTENCITQIVDKFYNNELTGVGIGSGVTIIGMMAGIAVLKKKLDQQQKINKDLETKNPNGNITPNNNGGSRSSTENLTNIP